MKTFYIIDGHALCYRAYYAFIKNPLTNSEGQNTSAIFGFAKMVLQLIREQNPDYIAVAFDPPGRSFRFEMYEEYKANRKKMPDDLRSQIDEIKAMVGMLDIPSVMVEGFEADDVLGTLAKKYSSDFDVYLVTGDKDAYQLVDDHVKIYANTKGVSEYTIYDREAVVAKLGLGPESVIDYMALVGDTSDNVPGVKGIGPKGAQKLIDIYGSIEKLYENLEELKGKQKSTIEENRENAFLSKDLVTIRTDVECEFDIEKAKFDGFDGQKCSEYFKEMEMPSIVTEYFSDEVEEHDHRYDPEKVDYKLVLTRDDLGTAVKEIASHDLIAVDTETTSVHPVSAELVGISVSCREHQGWYFPVKEDEGLFGGESPVEYTSAELIDAISPVLTDEKIRKVGQNIKYDIIVLNRAGIKIGGVYFDTMLASYVLDPSGRRHNMDDLAELFLGYKTIKYSDLVGTGKKALPITEVPLDELAVYAIEDTDITFRLYKHFESLLERAAGLKSLFYTVEMPLAGVLATMEQNGIIIDLPYFKKLSKQNEEELMVVEKAIHDHAGGPFNINSTRELAALLFDRLGLDRVKKTKTGYSTDISVLEALKEKHPVVELLIRYRTLSKLKNTYIDTLPKLVHPHTGRIHTSYNQTVAVTGRLSSTDPNLQNIPVKDDFRKQIRGGFIAPKGAVLVSADYSQIELRLTAHISGDENMKKAFIEGTDIHRLTASNVYGVAIDEVEDWQRRKAKIVNFSTIYGVTPFGLSRQSDISISEAKEFIDRYFETYPGVKEYIDRTVEFCREHGYVETLMGRRRYLPEISSKTSFRREGAERIAINSPIQGTSADMLKIAMNRIQAYLEREKLRSKMLLQVHDELVFELYEGEEALIDVVVELMENAIEIDVPIKVDVGRGANWEEAH